MNYLFVGGSLDGQRMATKADTIRIPVRSGKSISHLDFRYEIYRAFRIEGNLQSFTIYGLEDLSSDDILQSLINNYNPKKSDISP